MSLYANLATTARNLIAKFGQSATLTHFGASSYDEATGAVSASSSVTTPSVVPLPVGSYGQAPELRWPGTVVEAGMVTILMNPSGQAPEVGDTVAVGGTTYRLHAINKLAPGGTAVLYDCLASR